jgi:hypothetical protein
MDETYRMLGRERQADLDREAARWNLARTRNSRPSIAMMIWRTATRAAARSIAGPLRRSQPVGKSRAAAVLLTDAEKAETAALA